MIVCVRGRVRVKLGGTAGVYALVPATILLGIGVFLLPPDALCNKKEFPRKKQKEEIKNDKSTLQNSAFRAGASQILV